MSLLDHMQNVASKGASGLLPDAVGALTAAILRSQQSNGGFGGLDGKPDLYYTFFARLSLIALGVDYDHAGLTGWTRGLLKTSRSVDRVCAELILLQEGARSRVAATLFLLGSLVQLGVVDSYKLFLTAFLMEELLPQWLSRALLNRAAAATLKQRARTDFNSLSTPRAAVCALLAYRVGDEDMQQRMVELWSQRHLSSGGYSSTAGTSADLLSTAVVLFAGSCLDIPKITSAENWSGSDGDCGNPTFDRAFIEMCWQEDGLFSSAPDQIDGDLEHTFYALLALGCL